MELKPKTYLKKKLPSNILDEIFPLKGKISFKRKYFLLKGYYKHIILMGAVFSYFGFSPILYEYILQIYNGHKIETHVFNNYYSAKKFLQKKVTEPNVFKYKLELNGAVIDPGVEIKYLIQPKICEEEYIKNTSITDDDSSVTEIIGMEDFNFYLTRMYRNTYEFYKIGQDDKLIPINDFIRVNDSYFNKEAYLYISETKIVISSSDKPPSMDIKKKIKVAYSGPEIHLPILTSSTVKRNKIVIEDNRPSYSDEKDGALILENYYTDLALQEKYKIR